MPNVVNQRSRCGRTRQPSGPRRARCGQPSDFAGRHGLRRSAGRRYAGRPPVGRDALGLGRQTSRRCRTCVGKPATAATSPRCARRASTVDDARAWSRISREDGARAEPGGRCARSPRARRSRSRISRGLVTVPDVVGQTRDDAVAAVAAPGSCRRRSSFPRRSRRAPSWPQSPQGGTRVPGGSKVRLNISSGSSLGRRPSASTTATARLRLRLARSRRTVTVPDVTGQPAGHRPAAAQLGGPQVRRRLRAVGRAGGDGRLAVARSRHDAEARHADPAQRLARVEPRRSKAVPDVLGLGPTAAKTKLDARGLQGADAPAGRHAIRARSARSSTSSRPAARARRSGSQS